MNNSLVKELLAMLILGLLGLLFLWVLLPVPVSMFNYLPLFLISYILAIFLPGYTFLSFIKPDMDFRARLELSIPLSLVLLFFITSLFIWLQIPLAFTYAISVLMILSLIMALLTYLGDKLDKKGPEKVDTPPRKTPENEKKVEVPHQEGTAAPATEKKVINKPPMRRKRRLIPPKGEVEVIIPNHGKNRDPPGKVDQKTGLKLPWIERQKELDRQNE